MLEPITDLNLRIARGCDYFNREYFFEAHDVFEELWMEAREPQTRTLFHGLVHLATGFYHLRMNNAAGMRSQLHKGLTKLAALPSPCYGIALAPLLACVEIFLAQEASNAPPPLIVFHAQENTITRCG